MALVNIKIEGFPYLVDDSLTVYRPVANAGIISLRYVRLKTVNAR